MSSTVPTTTVKPAVQSVEAILKMMELAQQRNTQPRCAAMGNGAATIQTSIVYSVETVLTMMELAQKQNLSMG